ncbi:TetR family transcriptional regulator [Micromonospora sp. ATCC 39149]|nr:TetR family transcriptional regulator [Micromonospora sp. ATCC 39149]
MVMQRGRMPKQVDHEERRETISQAVWQVVSDSGLEGLTLRAVAAAAGCTTGMVTHYFSGKKMLLAHARTEMHRRMAARIDTLPAAASARDTLYAVAEQALPLDSERHLEAVVWSQFLLTTRHDPALLAEHTRSHASWIRRLTGLVRAACPAVTEPELLDDRVRSLVACLDGLALNAVTDPDAYPPDLQRRVLQTQLDLIVERNHSK